MCDEMTTLTPFDANVRTKAAKACAATGSSPLNGSSRSNTLGEPKQGSRNGQALAHALAEVIQRLVFSAAQSNKGEQAFDGLRRRSPHVAELCQGVNDRGTPLPTNLFWHVAHPLAKVVHRSTFHRQIGS